MIQQKLNHCKKIKKQIKEKMAIQMAIAAISSPLPDANEIKAKAKRIRSRALERTVVQYNRVI